MNRKEVASNIDEAYISKRREVFKTYFSVTSSGCWQWDKCLTLKGYGRFSMLGNGNIEAHRISLLFFKDIPLSTPGLDADHLCRNRACVNPEHLELVPRSVNLLRGNGACANNARRTHCKNGHPLPDDRFCVPCRQKSNRAAYERRKQKKRETV